MSPREYWDDSCAVVFDLYVGSGDLDSGCQAWTAGAFLAETVSPARSMVLSEIGEGGDNLRCNDSNR